MVPFYYQPTQTTFSLFWPLYDLDYGGETRLSTGEGSLLFGQNAIPTVARVKFLRRWVYFYETDTRSIARYLKRILKSIRTVSH